MSDVKKLIMQNDDIVTKIHTHPLHYICDHLNDVMIYNFITKTWKHNLIENVRYHLNLRLSNLISEHFYQEFLNSIERELKENSLKSDNNKRVSLTIFFRKLFEKERKKSFDRKLTI